MGSSDKLGSHKLLMATKLFDYDGDGIFVGLVVGLEYVLVIVYGRLNGWIIMGMMD